MVLHLALSTVRGIAESIYIYVLYIHGKNWVIYQVGKAIYYYPDTSGKIS